MRLLLSLPTLVGPLALSAIGGYYGLTGHTTDLGALNCVLQWPLAPVLLLLYAVFGPMAGVVVCLLRRVRAEDTPGDGPSLAVPLARMNTAALCIAPLAAGLVLLLVGTGMLVRGGT